MRSRLTVALLLMLPALFLAAGASQAAADHQRAGTVHTAFLWIDHRATVPQWEQPGVSQQQPRMPRLHPRSGSHAVPAGLAVLPAAPPYHALPAMGQRVPAGFAVPVPPTTSIAPARAPPSAAD